MLSKCHNVTDPVTQNDCLVLVSNALYSIYALWDVVLMFMCVSALSGQTNIMWNQGPVPLTPTTPTPVPCLCLDRVFRWRAEIMN